MNTFLALGSLLLVTLGGCGSPFDRDYYDVGGFGRPITTQSVEAQTWFDRGLAMCYGFCYEEALRCFERAIEADAHCAMAYWGLAQALGPNYNDLEVDAQDCVRALEALQSARANAAAVSPLERALIEAQSLRFAWPPPEDRRDLDRRFSEAMRSVHARFPDDSDVAAWTAESLMNLRPWQLWSPEGVAAPETAEILRILEAGLATDPSHPGLCHLLVHALEASPEPSRALAAADVLRTRMPGLGHLVHMSSHIDVRIGRYEPVIRANLRAIEADRAYVRDHGREGPYTYYRIHNFHFLVYGAMFDGQSELALRAARELLGEIPDAMLQESPEFLDGFVATPLHVLVRFGRWQDILTEPCPPVELPFSRTIHHYARSVALATLGRIEEAEREFERTRAAAEAIPETFALFNNSCRALADIALAMAEGELRYRQGRFEEAFALLRTAVRLDDSLAYDEPWGWMQPTRHALGALLLEQGHVEEALSVYHADLERRPKNGWALHGLAECLDRLDRSQEADSVRRAIDEAWSRADVPLRASCLCRVAASSPR